MCFLRAFHKRIRGTPAPLAASSNVKKFQYSSSVTENEYPKLVMSAVAKEE